MKILFSGKIPILVIVILHLVGIAGMLSPHKAFFNNLSAVHLVICFIFLAGSMKKKDAAYVATFLSCYLIGFAAEWIGVHTGYLFGNYSYGSVLGPKLDAIPLLIGINWYLLAISSHWLVSKFKQSIAVSVFLAAGLMTGIDVLIEPVAVDLGFWSWQGGDIPWTNYLCWFVVSLPMQWICFSWHKENNLLAGWLLLMQLLFFGILHYNIVCTGCLQFQLF
jgi:putative membrane protein